MSRRLEGSSSGFEPWLYFQLAPSLPGLNISEGIIIRMLLPGSKRLPGPGRCFYKTLGLVVQLVDDENGGPEVHYD